MNTTTNANRYILIAALTLALPACGDPCMPTVLADTEIIPAEDACLPDSESGGTTTGETCEPVPVVDAPVCIAEPGVGGMWGPCGDNACGDGMLCATFGEARLCAPLCDECGCPGDGICLGGACSAEGAAPSMCLPMCATADDCPFDGMACNSGVCSYSPQ